MKCFWHIKFGSHAACNIYFQFNFVYFWRSGFLFSSKIPSLLEQTGWNPSDGKKPVDLTLVHWQTENGIFPVQTRWPIHINTYKLLKDAGVTKEHFIVIYRLTSTSCRCVSMGTWGEDVVKLIKRIGELMQNVTGEKRSTSFLIQTVSVLVQRGNYLLRPLNSLYKKKTERCS